MVHTVDQIVCVGLFVPCGSWFGGGERWGRLGLSSGLDLRGGRCGLCEVV
jgi:hypothetical protein